MNEKRKHTCSLEWFGEYFESARPPPESFTSNSVIQHTHTHTMHVMTRRAFRVLYPRTYSICYHTYLDVSNDTPKFDSTELFRGLMLIAIHCFHSKRV